MHATMYFPVLGSSVVRAAPARSAEGLGYNSQAAQQLLLYMYLLNNKMTFTVNVFRFSRST